MPAVDSNSLVNEEMICRATYRAKEVFTEACSALYNDILNSADFQQETSLVEKVIHRQMELTSQGLQLSDIAPQYTDMVTHKLRAVSRAIENANFVKTANAIINKDTQEPVAFSQLRKWILTTNEKLMHIEEKVAHISIPNNDLKQIYVEQQIFQKRIEKEGRSLIDSVCRCIKRNNEVASEEEQKFSSSPQERRLKILRQRWHDIWLRSLVVLCRIETALGLQQEEEDLELSDDSREPPSKKRRTLVLPPLDSKTKELLESEEDTIPFTEDEYERIPDIPKMSQLRVNTDRAMVEDAEHQPDVGYSSGENSVIDSLNDPNCERTAVVGSDLERRIRIDSSPVKSYYKTVPLDDAGATDTEIPRLPVASTFFKARHDVLTDSLLVNVEENSLHSENDMEEVLALFDEDFENKAQQTYFQAQIDYVKQGTKWRQISSAQRGKRCSQGSLPLYKQNSCDASSEESEEELGERSESCIIKSQCNSYNSLKRRHMTRFNKNASLKLKEFVLYGGEEVAWAPTCSPCSFNMTTSQISEPSTSSFESPLRDSVFHYRQDDWSFNRDIYRRKLHARRLPRSVSNIEHVNNLMSISTHSAPGTTKFFCNSCMESDDTAPEQSDAPPYEWDDYNPPVKGEGVGEIDRKEATPACCPDDDLQMHFDEDIKICIAESRAALRNANALLGCQPTGQILEDLRTMASTQAERLSTLALVSPRHIEGSSDINDIRSGWEKILATVESLTAPLTSVSDSGHLPIILSKVEKFASSLKCLQEVGECCKPSMCSISSIKSLDDVMNTLQVFGEIHKRLVGEREELATLLRSDTFSGDLVGLVADFEPLSMQYEEAIEKVEQLVRQVENVRQNWSDWTETQSNLQNIIVDIEDELAAMRKGSNNCSQIACELELCQERMNRLETVCNYLTASLSELPDNSSASKVIDFSAELNKYSIAIMQLKLKFESLRSNPSPTIDKATSTYFEKSIIRESSRKTVTDTLLKHEHLSWRMILLFCSAAIVLFAWFTTQSSVVNNWKNAPGLHLDYVNGPPPM